MAKLKIKRILRTSDSKMEIVKHFTEILNFVYANEHILNNFKENYNEWSHKFTTEWKLCESAKLDAIRNIKLSRFVQILSTAIFSLCILEYCNNFNLAYLILGLYFYLSLIVMNFVSILIIRYFSLPNKKISAVHKYFHDVSSVLHVFSYRYNTLQKRFNSNIRFPSDLYLNEDHKYEETKPYMILFSVFLLYDIFGIILAFTIFILSSIYHYENLLFIEIFALYLVIFIALSKDIKIFRLIAKMRGKRKTMKNSTENFISWFEGNCELKNLLQKSKLSKETPVLTSAKLSKITSSAECLNAAILTAACENILHSDLSNYDLQMAISFLIYEQFRNYRILIRKVTDEVIQIPEREPLQEKNQHAESLDVSPDEYHHVKFRSSVADKESKSGRRERSSIPTYNTKHNASLVHQGDHVNYTDKHKNTSKRTVKSRIPKYRDMKTSNSPSDKYQSHTKHMTEATNFDECLQVRPELLSSHSKKIETSLNGKTCSKAGENEEITSDYESNVTMSSPDRSMENSRILNLGDSLNPDGYNGSKDVLNNHSEREFSLLNDECESDMSGKEQNQKDISESVNENNTEVLHLTSNVSQMKVNTKDVPESFDKSTGELHIPTNECKTKNDFLAGLEERTLVRNEAPNLIVKNGNINTDCKDVPETTFDKNTDKSNLKLDKRIHDYNNGLDESNLTLFDSKTTTNCKDEPKTTFDKITEVSNLTLKQCNKNAEYRDESEITTLDKSLEHRPHLLNSELNQKENSESLIADENAEDVSEFESHKMKTSNDESCFNNSVHKLNDSLSSDGYKEGKGMLVKDLDKGKVDGVGYQRNKTEILSEVNNQDLEITDEERTVLTNGHEFSPGGIKWNQISLAKDLNGEKLSGFNENCTDVTNFTLNNCDMKQHNKNSPEDLITNVDTRSNQNQEIKNNDVKENLQCLNSNDDDNADDIECLITGISKISIKKENSSYLQDFAPSLLNYRSFNVSDIEDNKICETQESKPNGIKNIELNSNKPETTFQSTDKKDFAETTVINCDADDIDAFSETFQSTHKVMDPQSNDTYSLPSNEVGFLRESVYTESLNKTTIEKKIPDVRKKKNRKIISARRSLFPKNENKQCISNTDINSISNAMNFKNENGNPLTDLQEIKDVLPVNLNKVITNPQAFTAQQAPSITISNQTSSHLVPSAEVYSKFINPNTLNMCQNALDSGPKFTDCQNNSTVFLPEQCENKFNYFQEIPKNETSIKPQETSREGNNRKLIQKRSRCKQERKSNTTNNSPKMTSKDIIKQLVKNLCIKEESDDMFTRKILIESNKPSDISNNTEEIIMRSNTTSNDKNVVNTSVITRTNNIEHIEQKSKSKVEDFVQPFLFIAQDSGNGIKSTDPVHLQDLHDMIRIERVQSTSTAASNMGGISSTVNNGTTSNLYDKESTKKEVNGLNTDSTQQKMRNSLEFGFGLTMEKDGTDTQHMQDNSCPEHASYNNDISLHHFDETTTTEGQNDDSRMQELYDMLRVMGIDVNYKKEEKENSCARNYSYEEHANISNKENSSLQGRKVLLHDPPPLGNGKNKNEIPLPEEMSCNDNELSNEENLHWTAILDESFEASSEIDSIPEGEQHETKSLLNVMLPLENRKEVNQNSSAGEHSPQESSIISRKKSISLQEGRVLSDNSRSFGNGKYEMEIPNLENVASENHGLRSRDTASNTLHAAWATELEQPIPENTSNSNETFYKKVTVANEFYDNWNPTFNVKDNFMPEFDDSEINIKERRHSYGGEDSFVNWQLLADMINYPNSFSETCLENLQDEVTYTTIPEIENISLDERKILLDNPLLLGNEEGKMFSEDNSYEDPKLPENVIKSNTLIKSSTKNLENGGIQDATPASNQNSNKEVATSKFCNEESKEVAEEICSMKLEDLVTGNDEHNHTYVDALLTRHRMQANAEEQKDSGKICDMQDINELNFEHFTEEQIAENLNPDPLKYNEEGITSWIDSVNSLKPDFLNLYKESSVLSSNSLRTGTSDDPNFHFHQSTSASDSTSETSYKSADTSNRTSVAKYGREEPSAISEECSNLEGGLGKKFCYEVIDKSNPAFEEKQIISWENSEMQSVNQNPDDEIDILQANDANGNTHTLVVPREEKTLKYSLKYENLNLRINSSSSVTIRLISDKNDGRPVKMLKYHKYENASEFSSISSIDEQVTIAATSSHAYGNTHIEGEDIEGRNLKLTIESENGGAVKNPDEMSNKPNKRSITSEGDANVSCGNQQGFSEEESAKNPSVKQTNVTSHSTDGNQIQTGEHCSQGSENLAECSVVKDMKIEGNSTEAEKGLEESTNSGLKNTEIKEQSAEAGQCLEGSNDSDSEIERNTKDFLFETEDVGLKYVPDGESDTVDVKFRRNLNQTKLTFKSTQKKLYVKMNN